MGSDEKLGNGEGARKGEGVVSPARQSCTPRSPTFYFVTFKTRTGVNTG